MTRSAALCRGLTIAAVAVLPASTFAAPDEGLTLLRKAISDSPRLSYSGVFTYRSGTREETSRVAYSAEGGRVRERIEVLEGSPREVVREGEQVSCFLPDENLLVIETRSRRRSFPGVLPSGGADIVEHYAVRRGGDSRIAGVEARAVVLEPRDAFRYGHEFWIDPASGMLLKSALRTTTGEPLESFTFTQISLRQPPSAADLAPRFDDKQLRVRKVEVVDVRAEDAGWLFRNLPSGFRKQHVMRRPGPGGDGLHVVFSDGLATFSAFIEPAGEKFSDGATAVGSVQVFRRRIDGHQAVVMGEVPAATVRRVAEGIERRGR